MVLNSQRDLSSVIFVVGDAGDDWPPLRGDEGHLSFSWHPLGIAGKLAGKSFNTQWAFRQLWKQVRNLTSATSAVCS